MKARWYKKQTSKALRRVRIAIKRGKGRHDRCWYLADPWKAIRERNPNRYLPPLYYNELPQGFR